MIDDLTTRGVTEPYRMFTSRAEFRLSLRADNADQRLTPMGLELGCVGDERRQRFLEKRDALNKARNVLTRHDFTPTQASTAGIRINQDGARRTAMQLLAFPDVTFNNIEGLHPDFSSISSDIAQQMEREALYANYIERQKKDIALMRKDENQTIPSDFNYAQLDGLSNELKSKLEIVRPATLAQMARIDGMTPAALTLVLAKIRQKQKRRSA